MNEDILRFLNSNLPFVKKPARYIGGEYHSVYKDPENIDIRVVLIFPDVYEIGMSNHGLEIIYNILNSLDYVWAERAYLPWKDMIEKMKDKDIPLFSLETKTPLNIFDIMGISLEYELSYTNVLEILKLAKVPIKAEERKESDPLVIGGGPLAANPEPIAPAFDALLIGDGEKAVIEIAEIVKNFKGEKREELLKELSKIQGVYIPRFYKQVGEKIIPAYSFAKPKIEKRVLKDLDNFLPPLKKVIPHVESVHDRAVIEVMRGCTRGCRFCHAGMVYRPIRERDPKKLFEWSLKLLENTGYEEISLLSLSTMDYSSIGWLTGKLIPALKKDRIALSIPSTRVDVFGVEIAQRVAGIRRTGLTFAPEAGTQRLRDVINKNITEEDIFSTAAAALKAGWQRIKLYFMIGLPTETEEDLLAITKLLKKIKNMGFKTVRASVAVFVPKPHTPFQFAKQISIEEAYEKIKIVKKARKFAKVDFHDPKMSFIEGVLSRGGREIFDVISLVNTMGEVFDEWRESFDFTNWLKAFEILGINPQDYLGPFEFDDPLPWDHIWAGIDKSFLIKEYEAALQGKTIPDCRWGRCNFCGVCTKSKTSNVIKQI